MSWETRISLVKACRSMEPVRRKEWVGGGQWRRHSKAWQGICPARNSSALPAALCAALAVKELIVRLFIKCKIMALWLTELRQIFEYKPGLKHKIRVSNIRGGPNLKRRRGLLFVVLRSIKAFALG